MRYVRDDAVICVKRSWTYTNVALCQLVRCDLNQLAEFALILARTYGHGMYSTSRNFYVAVCHALT
jgi:hypothetical protein